MATMKQTSVTLVALMLALVALAAVPGGGQAVCDASQLTVCLPAITSGRKPTSECCANLTAQQGCLCQYAKDPYYGRYVGSPYASKTLQSCGIPVPQYC